MEKIFTHNLIPQSIIDYLTTNENFRIRLHFEMGDNDIVIGGKNINYIPQISEFQEKIRLYQNDKVKIINNTSGIKLNTRFFFTINSNLCAIKLTRIIYLKSNNVSNSEINIIIKRTEISEKLTEILKLYIFKRVQKQNYLLDICSKNNLNNTYPIPFNDFLTDIRNSVNNFEIMIKEEHEIDPIISQASTELQKLKFEVENISRSLIFSLQKRDLIEKEIFILSEETKNTTKRINNLLLNNLDPININDKKNDIAFSLTLIPIVVIFLGYFFKKKK